MPSTSHDSSTTVEATVTSKGQVTLPKELRKRLGIHKGSRIRFNIPSTGAVKVEPVRYKIRDLWRIADDGGKSEGIMSFEEMNEAKARRRP
ncbi:MAG: AbrB/MazE/SpoVT family DNA-binding domain-containing protein [Acidobacteriaceae bacterium]